MILKNGILFVNDKAISTPLVLRSFLTVSIMFVPYCDFFMSRADHMLHSFQFRKCHNFQLKVWKSAIEVRFPTWKLN